MRRASIYLACLVLVVAADAQERADSTSPPGVSEAALGRNARERGLPAVLEGEWISQAVHHHRDGTQLVETGRVDCGWTLERPEQGLPAGTLAAVDRDAVLAVTREYLDAWLANDSARVMATFLSNAVLLPSGMAPISGEQAIRAFWFPPDGPPTRVTAMEQEVTDVVGNGDRAIVVGRGTLTFQVGRDGKSRTQRSWFANVLTRQPGGRWLMARRIWVDLP